MFLSSGGGFYTRSMVFYVAPMTVNDATRELRRIAAKSQQVMATELGLATKSLQFYETGQRVPEPGKLLWLMAYADTHAPDRADIYDAFTTALMKQLLPPPGYEVELKFKPSPPAKKGKKK